MLSLFLPCTALADRRPANAHPADHDGMWRGVDLPSRIEATCESPVDVALHATTFVWGASVFLPHIATSARPHAASALSGRAASKAAIECRPPTQLHDLSLDAPQRPLPASLEALQQGWLRNSAIEGWLTAGCMGTAFDQPPESFWVVTTALVYSLRSAWMALAMHERAHGDPADAAAAEGDAEAQATARIEAQMKAFIQKAVDAVDKRSTNPTHGLDRPATASSTLQRRIGALLRGLSVADEQRLRSFVHTPTAASSGGRRDANCVQRVVGVVGDNGQSLSRLPVGPEMSRMMQEARQWRRVLTGEQACEEHGWDEKECLAIGCCAWDAQAPHEPCYSAVGDGACDDSELLHPSGPTPAHESLPFERLRAAWAAALGFLESDELQHALATVADTLPTPPLPPVPELGAAPAGGEAAAGGGTKPGEQMLTLSNGVRVPRLVFGTVTGGGERPVVQALRAGYRHIDTAKIYGNEASVGRAIRASGLQREEVCITSKLRGSIENVGEAARDAVRRQLADVQTHYFDVFMVHHVQDMVGHPECAKWDKEVGVSDGTGCFWATWRVLEELHEQGTLRALAVSNLPLHMLRRMWPQHHAAALVGVPPHVYQGYTNAYVSTAPNDLDVSEGHLARVSFLERRNVTIMPHSVLSAWPNELAPISDPLVAALATARGVVPAVVLQRHQLQKGRLVLTRPGSLAHMRSNLHDVAALELGADEMRLLDALPWLVQECQPDPPAGDEQPAELAAGGLKGMEGLPLLRELVPRCCDPLMGV